VGATAHAGFLGIVGVPLPALQGGKRIFHACCLFTTI
jgi:hypothetical protein